MASILQRQSSLDAYYGSLMLCSLSPITLPSVAFMKLSLKWNLFSFIACVVKLYSEKALGDGARSCLAPRSVTSRSGALFALISFDDTLTGSKSWIVSVDLCWKK